MSEEFIPTVEQQDYIDSKERKTLVLACPGSGKTEVLTQKIASLVNKGVNPRKILALSFTQKAANEMRGRISNLTGITAWYKLKYYSTFHSFGSKIIHDYYLKLGFVNDPILANKDKRAICATKVLRDFGIKGIDSSDFLDCVSDVKNGISLELICNEHSFFSKEVFERYNKELLMNDYIDLDDLVFLLVSLMEKNEFVRLDILNMFDYVFVDEYQDVNPIQIRFLDFFEKANKFVSYVGDDDQSIYQFRGSEPKYLIDKSKSGSGFTVYYLSINWRSEVGIVEFANEFLADMTKRGERADKRTSRSEKPTQIKPVIKVIKSSKEEEISYICKKINELVNDENVDPCQIAVLSRWKTKVNGISELKEVQSRLAEYGIESTDIVADDDGSKDLIQEAVTYLCKFIDRIEKDDIISSINLLGQVYSDLRFDDLAGQLETLLGLSFANYKGARRIETIVDYGVENITQEIKDTYFGFEKMIDTFLFLKRINRLIHEGTRASEIIYEIIVYGLANGDRLFQSYKNVLISIKSFANQYDSSLEATFENYKETVSHIQNCFLQFDYELEKGKVNLLTMHKSKGLGFDIVFVMGLEAGNFPLKSTEEKMLQSERRIFYVAMTRAKHLLVVTATGYTNNIQDEQLISLSFLKSFSPDKFVSDVQDLSTITFDSRPSSIFTKYRESAMQLLEMTNEINGLSLQIQNLQFLVDKYESACNTLETQSQEDIDKKKQLEYTISELKKQMNVLIKSGVSSADEIERLKSKNTTIEQLLKEKESELAKQEVAAVKDVNLENKHKEKIIQLNSLIEKNNKQISKITERERLLGIEVEKLKKENLLIPDLQKAIADAQRQAGELAQRNEMLLAAQENLVKKEYRESYYKLDPCFKDKIDKISAFYSEWAEVNLFDVTPSLFDDTVNKVSDLIIVMNSNPPQNKITRFIKKNCFRDELTSTISLIVREMTKFPSEFTGKDKRKRSTKLQYILNLMKDGDSQLKREYPECHKEIIAYFNKESLSSDVFFKTEQLFRNMAVLTALFSHVFHADSDSKSESNDELIDWFLNTTSTEKKKQIFFSYHDFMYYLVCGKTSSFELFKKAENTY